MQLPDADEWLLLDGGWRDWNINRVMLLTGGTLFVSRNSY